VDEIEARLNAATPGPWQWSPEEDTWGDCGPNLETVERGQVYSDGSQGAEAQVIGSWGHDANGISVADGDAEFIAHSPTDVAFLLTELRKRDEAIARAKAQGVREAAEDILTGLANVCPEELLAIGFVEGYRDACLDAAVTGDGA
jgi:hypothetical protein